MAAHLRDSIIIHRSIEDVFHFFDDAERMVSVMPIPAEITSVESLPNGGKRVRFRTQGRRGKWCDSLAENTEYIPYRRVAIHGETEGVTTMAIRSFERVGDATRLTAEVSYSVHVPFLGPLIEFQWRRRSRQAQRKLLEHIRAKLEQSTA
jgi:hypothetical protein